MDRRVVRFDYWLDAAFDRIVSAAPGVQLVTCRREGDDAAAWQALAGAQVYQITSAKDELPRHWFATADLLALAAPICWPCPPAARAATPSTSRPARAPAWP